MKLLKYLLLGIAGVIALLLVIALFVPREFHSERSIVINRPQQEVYDYAKFLKNQQEYGVWWTMDPDITVSYEGTDGTVGFVARWKSKKVGDGEQEITGLQEPSRIDLALRFSHSKESAPSYIAITSEGENTSRVRWGISGKTPYPFNLMSLFYDIGNDFEKGLVKMKALLEE